MSNISINDLNSAESNINEGLVSLLNEIQDLSETELKVSGGGKKYYGGGDDDDDDDNGKGKGKYKCKGKGDDDDD